MKSYLFVCLFVVILLGSCKKEENATDVSNEVGKVETLYKEGDTKIETVASEEVKLQAKAELEKSFDKKNTLKGGDRFSGYVGVFKNTTCGSYQELELFMDCEDTKNSSDIQNAGSSYKDTKGNIGIKFCIVPNAFSRLYKDFGILDLSNDALPRFGVAANDPTGILMLKFHNESKGNINSTKIGGQKIGSSQFGITFIGRNDFAVLSFRFYPANTNFSSGYNPNNIGFSYGVLGLFYPAVDTRGRFIDTRQGFIYSDDEDTNNNTWWDKKGTVNRSQEIFVSNRNTRMNITMF